MAGRYEARDIAPEQAKVFFDELRAGSIGWVGCNVTLPHKIIAMENCDDVTAAAKKIGAVNTIVVRDKKLYGDNTDWLGFVNNLQSWPAFSSAKKNRAILLGAGGAARGVIYGLQYLGFKELVVANRSVEKLVDIKKDFHATVIDFSQLGDYLPTSNIVINATSVGLQEGDASLPIDFAQLPKDILLHDIIYGKNLTAFLTKGKESGFAVKDGLDMLIHQAIPGFQQWFNTHATPPIDNELRQYLLDYKN